MQFAKDSFLNHLATKLAELDGTKTVSIDGVTRPAVMAYENERAELVGRVESCYCINWGDVSADDPRAVQKLRCTVSYWTLGSPEMSGVDRGRALTEMDEILRKLLTDRKTAKVDLRVKPGIDLGSNILWSEPSFDEPEQDGMKVRRTVKIDVHYFAEAQ